MSNPYFYDQWQNNKLTYDIEKYNFPHLILNVINEKNYNYINILSAYVGTKLMEKYPADYIFNKYRQKQLEMCDHLNLEASPCVYFGIDRLGNFPEYNRGTRTNRLCFSRVWDGRM
jgi:hypothetical protein